MLTALGRASRCQQPIDGGRAHLQQQSLENRFDLQVTMALESLHKGGQHRRQAFAAEMVAGLPQGFQELHHLGAITPPAERRR